MEVYSPAISSAAAEYISTHQFQGHRRRRALRPGLAPAADESRRAGSGHRRHREEPERSDRDRMDVAARRHRARAQRRSRACAPSPATCCSGSPITRWSGRSIDVAERDLGAMAVGQRAIVRARSFPGREFTGKVNVIYPAAQQGDAHRARAHRTAQSGPAAAPRHVCRCRDRHRQRRAGARRSRKRGARQRQPAGRAGRQGRRPVRAARGQARPSRRRLCRGPRRHRRGRAGGDLGQLPDRCRKQSEGGAEGLCRGSASHDRPPHRLVGAQPAAGAVRHRLRRRGRHLCAGASAARRHSRPLRHAGDRLHRVSGPGAAGDRGPGHLSADHGDADRAELEGGARLLVLRRVVRLCHLRGRHRHLLGALARAGISQRRGLAAARRRDADPRPRRHRRRLGLPICRDVEGAEPRRHRARSRTGI